VIGADKAYGATGQPPDIPPDAPLAFEVDIVDIAPAPQ
jgi:FKBP-type peptidyl-prolyl cis-trans isomerase